ncbi:hypothetical protein [Demequina litorisediminis]|uniref:hypothetical protein n=1 Tax=Demequina litorisediminis TaxID=1849022 RepID=UPI003D67ABD2
MSLGSYGLNNAFDSVDDLLARTEGAVLAGTPSLLERLEASDVWSRRWIAHVQARG